MKLLLKMAIQFENDIVLARQYSRQIANLLKFDSQTQIGIATAVSELVRNAFQYAKGGFITFSIQEQIPQKFHICIEDQGCGIDWLDTVFSSHYQSSTGMGVGLKGAKRLADEFDIVSSEKGTTVIFEKYLPAGKEINNADIQVLINRLGLQLPQDSLQESQRQNQELLLALDEVQKQRIALEQLNQELEQTNRGVVALYAELDERADYLKQASDLKNQFFSNITHEFRTPLNSIISLSQMLLARMDGDLTEEQEKQVKFIYTGAKTLSDLVNDVLDLAKFEAGKVVVYPSSFDIKEMFRMLRGMLKPLFGHSEDVNLIFEEDEDLPLLISDEAKVSQILRNFISNGLKYTHQGEVRIQAKTYKDRVVFSVKDTGIGIAVEDQARIFEEFTQIEGEHQFKIKGTGLGLPLSRRLAHVLGGEIRLESQVNQGSTFFLSLPLVYKPIQNVDLSSHPLFGKISILIIDDNPADRYVVRHLLKPLTDNIVEASNGREGLTLAENLKPSIIILDFVMPDLTGAQVIKKLKRLETTCNIPVIIQTSKILTVKEKDFLLSIAHSILPKGDVTESSILKEVTSILNNIHDEYQKEIFHV